MELIKSKTYENLAKAFAGETMARTRYVFMSYGARQEGFTYMAKLIDNVVTQEFNHARMLYTFIQTATKNEIPNIDIASGYPFKEKWNLADNLKFAAEDEKFESEKIYPEYARTAEAEGFCDIAGLFNNLSKIENCHHMLFTDLYNQLTGGTLYAKDKPVKWKCADCGYEATSKEAWTECPVCQTKQGAVKILLEE